MLSALGIFFYFIAMAVTAQELTAQEKTIRGQVLDTEGQPVPYANIIVNDTLASPKSLGFTNSDPSGKFIIKLQTALPIVSVNITALGYAEKLEQVNLTEKETLKTFVLVPSPIDMAEVVVKARVQSDTIALDTTGMNLSNRSTLRDILNKTDGIVVNEDGGISFQGKPMNKILINKKEVFVNQNKVALDNLNYEMMEDVQIINNYKDKFVLDFNNIRDPVININTKPEFKGVLKGDISGGYGIRDSYMLEGKGFFFSDKYNAFATSNTNNVGRKDLSQRDVLGSTFDQASQTLRQHMFPFFIEDNRARRNVVSNNSLTLRSEGSKSKTGLTLYHGLIDMERELEQLIFIADTLIRNNLRTSTSKGHFLSGTIEYNQLLPSRSVIKNLFNVSTVYQNGLDEAIETIFTPSVQHFRENISDRPRSFMMGNHTQYTKLIGQRTALDLAGDYYYERNLQHLQTTLLNVSIDDLLQQSTYTKQQWSGMANINIRAARQSLNAGLTLRQSSDAGVLQIERAINDEYRLSRNILYVEMPFRFNGAYRAWEYNSIVTPFYMLIDPANRPLLVKTSQTYTYNFSGQHKLSVHGKRDFEFYHLNTLYDTIMRNFNQVISTNLANIHQLSQRDVVSAYWSKNDGQKGINHNYSYEFRRDKDFLQTVFDSISNNVFHYSNQVFDRRYTHDLQANTTKHMYLGKAYHRLSVLGGINYRSSEYPTVLAGEVSPATESTWRPKIKFSFAPRNCFVREMEYQIELDHFVFHIDRVRAMHQTVLSNRLMIRGQGKKTEWRVNVENHAYWLENEKFNVPDLAISYIFDLSDKWSFSLVSRALLTLFNVNNFQFAQTQSEGNISVRTTTDNNLGYLLLRTSLKF